MKILKVNTDKDLMILNKLLQVYEAEFSAITKKVPDHSGDFKLDVNISNTDNYLLYTESNPVGFCIKGISDSNHDIYEFYVVPSKRGGQLGRNFAKTIFSMYRGSWQVRQISGADKAISFWCKAISEFTSNSYHESVTEDAYWGQVTKQIFESK